MTSSIQATPNLYALLIGINFYLPNVLPDGTYFKNLHGCVRDINGVEDFLKSQLELSDERIIKLTSSDGGGSVPAEAPELWPTKQNIVAAFERLAEVCQPGDQVYIHYSGHGGRVRTPPKFQELKGGDGYDEVLVPADICNTEDRYLRDFELAQLLRQLVERELRVTVVLDSCHSGGATRGTGALTPQGDGAVGVRAIGTVDAVFPPTEYAVASDAELAATWQTLSHGSTRALEVGSGWLEPKGYVLLAACRASEFAHEYSFDGNGKNGVLTYWLLDALREFEGRPTFRMAYDRALAHIHSQFPDQTPQLQGERDRVIFGGELTQTEVAAVVLSVDPGQQGLGLNAGQAQGITPGTRFAIYACGETNFTRDGGRIAEVKVSEVYGSSSRAEITKLLGSATIRQGDQAVLLDFGHIKFRRGVLLLRPDADTPGAKVLAALNEIEELLRENEKSFVYLVTQESDADFVVAVGESGEYVIREASGREVLNLHLALEDMAYYEPARLIACLTHLAKYYNVMELDNWDAQSPLARKLSLEVQGIQPDYVPGEKPSFQTCDALEGAPKLRVGEWLFLGIRNNHSQVLNVTVLDLQHDWGISQIFPQGAAFFEPLDPGQMIILPLGARLSEGYWEGRDFIKVFATIGPSNFRWLELSPLDRPQGATRKWSETPTRSLADLLSAITHEDDGLRTLELAKKASSEWTAAQLEVTLWRQ